MTFFESSSLSSILFEHDLFGKPASTFPDHALGSGRQLADSNKRCVAITGVSECPGRSEKGAPHLERRERPAPRCTRQVWMMPVAAVAEDRISSRPPCAATPSLRP